MKKIFSVVCAILMIALIGIFTGCSAASTLPGTTWTYNSDVTTFVNEEVVGEDAFSSFKLEMTFKFEKDGLGTFSYKPAYTLTAEAQAAVEAGSVDEDFIPYIEETFTESANITWEAESNEVKIIAPNEDNTTLTITGTLNKKVLALTFPAENAVALGGDGTSPVTVEFAKAK